MKKIIVITSSILTILIISLLIFNLFTMRSIKTEVIIDASPKDVWNVLMDHQNYADWNPFIKHISGSTKEGEYLNVMIQNADKDLMKFEPKVITNLENQEFRWKGKLFVEGLFDGEHYFILQQVSSNKTKFIQGENFTGLLSGALIKMIGKDTEQGFKTMNIAFKNIVENK